MPTFDDIVAGAADNSKQQLQEALLELFKGNPDILESVSKLSQSNGQPATDETLQPLNQKANEGVKKPKRSQPFPEVQNSLNWSPREEYQWILSDKDDGIDNAWSSVTKNMTPRELTKWRKGLYSVYIGHLPGNITKRELGQLFSEVGSVQDVHVQPASCGAYTYGFVRYSTLEECRDAVAELHGRMLGNKTICVEYACETKQRLEHGDDPNDLPLDKNDKLLRREYPSVNFRSMSEEESQEKIILWKLRSSATKLMSSQAGCVQDRQDSSKGETLMDKIQEVIKKVVGLPADTLASPTALEGSPFSSWILDWNDNKSEMETDKQKCGLQDPSDLIMRTKEMSGGSKCKEEKSAGIFHTSQSPFKEQKISISIINGSAPGAIFPEHSPETFAAPNSHIHNNSSLSEDGFSPGCGNSSYSELDTTASDSFSIASLSPDRSLKKHCHSLDGSQVEVATPSPIETVPTVRLSEENAYLCKEDHVEQNPSGNQSNHREPSLQSYEVKRGEHCLQKIGKMGICNFDVSDPYAYVQRSLPCEEQPVEKVNEHSTADCAVVTTESSCSIQPEQILLEMPHVTVMADCQNSIVNNSNSSHMVRSNCNGSQSLQVGNTSLTPLVNDYKRVGQSGQPDEQKDPILAAFPANNEQKRELQDNNNNKFKGTSCTPETERVGKEAEPCLKKNQADSNKRLNLSLPPLGQQRPCAPITVNGAKLVVQGSPNVNFPAAPHSPLYQQSSYTARTNNIDRMNLGFYRPPFGIPPILAQQLSLNQLNQFNADLFFQQQLAASVLGMRPPFYPGGSPCSNLGAPLVHPAGWGKGNHWSREKPKIGPFHAHDRQHQHRTGATPVIMGEFPGRKPSPGNPLSGSNLPPAGKDCAELKESNSKPSPQSVASNETSPIKHTTGASPKSPPVRRESDVESPARKTTPSPKPSQNELYLEELRAELDCVLKENKELRRHVYRQRSERGSNTHNDQKQEALESVIHSKELHLQKEKEIINARSADQELLYEREKLEAAFDQQLMRELEVEQQIGGIKNRLHLAKLESELLPLYQHLHNNTDFTC